MYYSVYNKAAGLEKIVLKSDAIDHRCDFITDSRQSNGKCCSHEALYIFL